MMEYQDMDLTPEQRDKIKEKLKRTVKVYSRDELEQIAIEFTKFFKKYEFIDDTTEGELYAEDSTGDKPPYTVKELFQEFLKTRQ